MKTERYFTFVSMMENEIVTRIPVKDLHKMIFDAVLGAMKLTNESAYRVTVEDSQPLSIEEAARFINYTVRSVYNLTSQKRIPHHKTGKKLFFFKSELTEWVKQDAKEKEVNHA